MVTPRLRRLTPLLVLETSTLFSGVANGVTMVAFPWLVLDLTGSAAAAGAIGAITALPLAVSFLFAGAVVDLARGHAGFPGRRLRAGDAVRGHLEAKPGYGQF